MGQLAEIRLTGLRVRGHHGVFAHERRDGQDFVVDAVLWLDVSRGVAHDDVTETVDYGELADRLADIVGGEPVNLIETLADRLLTACLTEPRVKKATVTVHKPQAPIEHDFQDVSVTLIREQREGP